jgi:hypothetical protein
MRNWHLKLPRIILTHFPSPSRLMKPVIDNPQQLWILQRRARIRNVMLNPVINLVYRSIEMKRRGSVITDKGGKQAVLPVLHFDFDKEVSDGADDDERDEGLGGEGGL